MDQTSRIIRPVIFEYSDYRLFLHDSFDFCKCASKSFSHRFFAKRAGFRTPNFLKLVIDGKRNLTIESIEQVGRGFKLNKEEQSFFMNLVLFNQADNPTQRDLHFEQMMRSRSFQKTFPLQAAQYEYYKKWYYIPVREMLALQDFKADPEWMSTRLGRLVSPAEIQVALDHLQMLGLVEKSCDGHIKQAQASLNTANEVRSSLIADYHKQMMQLGAASIDRVKASHREISSVCFSTSEETMREVKARIQAFREEILALVSGDSSPTSVYQLNFQFFPMTNDGLKGEI